MLTRRKTKDVTQSYKDLLGDRSSVTVSLTQLSIKKKDKTKTKTKTSSSLPCPTAAVKDNATNEIETTPIPEQDFNISDSKRIPTNLKTCVGEQPQSNTEVSVSNILTGGGGDSHLESEVETATSSNKTEDTSSSPQLVDNSIVQKPSQIILPDHVKQASGEDGKHDFVYNCEACHSQFYDKDLVKYHVYCGNKTPGKPYTCGQCGQTFIQKGHYDYHLKTHTGERPYTCGICGSSFVQSGKLTRHLKIHTGEKPYICEVNGCGKQFSNASAKKTHQVVHTGEKPFKCRVSSCQRFFPSMTNMKKHLITHTGEKPHECGKCGKSYGLKWTLAMHEKTHLPERPYPCSKCDRAFSVKKDLNRHLLIHTEELPFECTLCGTQKSFRRKDNLLRHIAKVHKESKEIASEIADEAADRYKTYSKQGTASPSNYLITTLGSNELKPNEVQEDGSTTILNEEGSSVSSIRNDVYSTTQTEQGEGFEVNTSVCLNVATTPVVPDLIESSHPTEPNKATMSISQPDKLNIFPIQNRPSSLASQMVKFINSTSTVEQKDRNKKTKKDQLNNFKVDSNRKITPKPSQYLNNSVTQQSPLDMLAEVAGEAESSVAIAPTTSPSSTMTNNSQLEDTFGKMSIDKGARNAIIVVGCSGIGKSHLCNRLFEIYGSPTRFYESASIESVTRTTQFGSITVNGISYTIIDTPGFFDVCLSESSCVDNFNVCELIRTIEACEEVCAIVYVMTSRFTTENMFWFNRLRSITKSGDHTVLVNNRVGYTKSGTIDDYEQIRNEHINRITQRLGIECPIKYFLITYDPTRTENRAELENLMETVIFKKALKVQEELIVPEICYEKLEFGETYSRLIEEHKKDEGKMIKNVHETGYYMNVKRTRQYFGLLGPHDLETRWVPQVVYDAMWVPNIVTYRILGTFQMIYNVRFDGTKDFVEEREVGRRTECISEKAIEIIEGGTNKRKLLETKKQLEENYKTKQLKFGEAHVETIEAGVELAQSLSQLEMYNESLELIQTILQTSMLLMGDNNELTIRVRVFTAEAFELAGDTESAMLYYSKAVEQTNSCWGFKSPATLNVMLAFGRLLIKGNPNQIKQGKQLLETVLKLREEIFGVCHPNVRQVQLILDAL